MKNLTQVAIAVAALALSACRTPASHLVSVTNHPKYRAGQVWRYKTRPNEESSTLTILAVEATPKLGTIIHLRVNGVRLIGPEGNVLDEIGHMPFAEAALAKSIVGLSSVGQPPLGPSDGYALWREAFDSGKAGIFSVSVAERVSFVEEASRHSSSGATNTKGGA